MLIRNWFWRNNYIFATIFCTCQYKCGYKRGDTRELNDFNNNWIITRILNIDWYWHTELSSLGQSSRHYWRVLFRNQFLLEEESCLLHSDDWILHLWTHSRSVVLNQLSLWVSCSGFHFLTIFLFPAPPSHLADTATQDVMINWIEEIGLLTQRTKISSSCYCCSPHA